MIDYGVVSGSTGESLALGLKGGAAPASTSVGAVDFAALMSDLAAAGLGTSDSLSAVDAAAMVASDAAPRASIASSRELAALVAQLAARIAAAASDGSAGSTKPGQQTLPDADAEDHQKERGDDEASTDRLAGLLDATPLLEVRASIAAAASGAADGESDNAPRYAPAPGREEIRQILGAASSIDAGSEPEPAAVDPAAKREPGASDRNPFLPLARLIEQTRAAADASDAAPPTAPTIAIVHPGTLAEAHGASHFFQPVAAPPPFAATAAFSDEPDAVASSTVSIVQAIRLQWTQGAGEARIQLEPEQFGTLAVTLRVVQGQVVARIESDTPAVREWLKTHQDVLHDALADRELTLEQFEIAEPEESASSHDRRQDDEQADRQWHPRRWRRPDTGVQFEVVV